MGKKALRESNWRLDKSEMNEKRLQEVEVKLYTPDLALVRVALEAAGAVAGRRRGSLSAICV